MKKYFALAVLLTVFFSSNSLFAQNLKFGHVNSQELFNIMPERKVAEDSIERKQKQLAEELEMMQVEANIKYETYMKERDTYSEAKRKMVEEELAMFQQRIQAFQMSAQEDLQRTQGALLKPISDKLNNAIKAVGDKNGFIYVFDENMLKYRSSKSVDITKLVKTELGIE